MASTAPQAPGQVTALDADGLERGVGFLGLLWASETSIIGSGWLFGALGAAVLAGPSAILGWVLGSVIILILALVHAELGGLFPVSGGTSRFPHYAFGSFAGATFGWASYLQAASVAPIEVLAAVEYLSTAHWARNFFHVSAAAGSRRRDAARLGLPGGGDPAAPVRDHQSLRYQVLRQDQQSDHELEGRDPGGDDPDPADRALPRLELRSRRGWLLHQPQRDQEHPADAAGRDHLLAARLRAGGAARRRVGQPGA